MNLAVQYSTGIPQSTKMLCNTSLLKEQSHKKVCEIMICDVRRAYYRQHAQ
jgi:hypothetical protein